MKQKWEFFPLKGGWNRDTLKITGVHPVLALGPGRSLHGPATCSWNSAGRGPPGTPASGCSTSLPPWRAWSKGNCDSRFRGSNPGLASENHSPFPCLCFPTCKAGSTSPPWQEAMRPPVGVSMLAGGSGDVFPGPRARHNSISKKHPVPHSWAWEPCYCPGQRGLCGGTHIKDLEKQGPPR